jgi:muramoyltetrapeptide carboxypeptidase LdcA involved in peptidoglycan recycling
MIYPKFLKPGVKIGVTACSDGKASEIDAKRLDHASKQFQALGYEVIETFSVRKSVKGRSCDANTRKNELLQLIYEDKIGAIILASGGDYLMEIIPLIDFNEIRQHPKWIQGYSDPTGLLYTITVNCDLATVYSSNFGDFGMGVWHSCLNENVEILEGKRLEQKSFDYYMDGYQEKVTGYEGFTLDAEVNWRNARNESEIRMRGRLLGGCLDVLLYMVGTKYDNTKEFIEKYKEDQIIWYLESYDLSSEQLATGLWNLREAGWFKYVKGFVFGRPCFYKSNYDATFDESVLAILDALKVPIIFDVDFGHKPPRMTFVNGAIGEIISRGGKGSLKIEME